MPYIGRVEISTRPIYETLKKKGTPRGLLSPKAGSPRNAGNTAGGLSSPRGILLGSSPRDDDPTPRAERSQPPASQGMDTSTPKRKISASLDVPQKYSKTTFVSDTDDDLGRKMSAAFDGDEFPKRSRSVSGTIVH